MITTLRKTNCGVNQLIIVKDATLEVLEKSDLLALLYGEAVAIRIKKVASEEQCSQLCRRAIKDQARQAHSAVDSLDIWGTPYYLAASDPEIERRYYDKARDFLPAIREMSAPAGSPMDSVLAILNDAWPAGFIPGRLDSERPMPPGILRIYDERSGGVRPHIDDIRQEAPTSEVANSLIGQFGYNLYAEMPSLGGELLIYRHKPSLAEFRSKAIEYYWETDLAGEPEHVLIPEIGELILINTRQLHSVAACGGHGYRVTISGFGGVSSEQRPGMIWA